MLKLEETCEEVSACWSNNEGSLSTDMKETKGTSGASANTGRDCGGGRAGDGGRN